MEAMLKQENTSVIVQQRTAFFESGLATQDAAVADILNKDLRRQQNTIELIASENLVSQAVMEAQGSILTNKYAEGYPGKRYYDGCTYVDEVERLAQSRLCQLFGANFANVQPHSGSQANQAVFAAVLKPGDKILGLSLDQGGHLTHGAAVNLSGKWFEAHFYGVHPETERIDYDALEVQARDLKPQLIIAGASAYPREIDFARFGKIAREVGAYLLVDMAHIAGLVAAGLHQPPFPHAHFVTSTTHKTLRGPRGGVVLTQDEELAKKVDSAIFPGLQGGPLMHVIAAKAVAFGEALHPDYKTYMQQVTKNAVVLGETLVSQGLRLVSGGTDNHLMLVDLRPFGVTGKDAAHALDVAGITCNKNAVPFDTASKFITSGIRLGAPASTSRGFKEAEFKKVGNWIVRVLKALASADQAVLLQEQNAVRAEVEALCAQFPIYSRAF